MYMCRFRHFVWCLFRSLLYIVWTPYRLITFFFFNDTATTEIYTYAHTLSLHDALPIWPRLIASLPGCGKMRLQRREPRGVILPHPVERDEHQRLQLVDADAEDIAGVANEIGFAGRAMLGPFLAFGDLHPDRLSIRPEALGRPRRPSRVLGKRL